MNRTLTNTLSVSDSSGASVALSSTISETATGSDFIAGTQSIPTAWTALNIGSCASADVVVIKNTDAANFVQVAIANDGTGIFAKITAGRSIALCVDPTATLYLKADTGAVVIEKIITEP